MSHKSSRRLAVLSAYILSTCFQILQSCKVELKFFVSLFDLFELKEVT